MAKHIVGRAGEIPPGERKIIEVAGRSIGVFNVQGTFYALRNSCPHQLAPLCRGHITGTTLPSQPGEYIWAREGEIIRCPWHGWEFDITNGESIFNPHRMRVKSYKVTVESATGVTTKEVTPDEKDPSVESYRVEVEEGLLVVHI
jgi:nitrite reductase (NADH) small subunit